MISDFLTNKPLFLQVVALQQCCSYKPCLPERSVQGDGHVSSFVEEEQVGVVHFADAVYEKKKNP